MTILIYVSYYSAAIIGIFIRRYFSRFTAADFYYNKPLSRRRIYALIYCYFVLFYSAIIVALTKQNILKSTFLVITAGFIIVLYIFFVGFLETSAKPRKKNNK